MNVEIAVALNDDEQHVFGEYLHTYVDRIVDENTSHPLYSPSTINLYTQAFIGRALSRPQWQQLYTWVADVDRYARDSLWGDAKLSYDLSVQVRGLCFEAIRLCKRSEPGAIAVSPGA